jgi:hypothetical protein
MVKRELSGFHQLLPWLSDPHVLTVAAGATIAAYTGRHRYRRSQIGQRESASKCFGDARARLNPSLLPPSASLAAFSHILAS